MSSEKVYGEFKGPYPQQSVKKRIEALFLDNLGKILDREQIQEAARDPKTGKIPENWHQRLSELRTDDGYTILSRRNRGYLNVQEYVMPFTDKRSGAAKRVKPNDKPGSRSWSAPNTSANGTRAGRPVAYGTARLILLAGAASS